MRINSERCVKLGRTLGRHRGWAEELEKRDPQFQALCALKELYPPERLLAVTMLNALVSYRLTSTGEEYWNEFSRYMAGHAADSKHPVDLMKSFLLSSKGNRLYLRTKMARISKMRGLVDRILSEPSLVNDLNVLWREVSQTLKAPPNSKTIVFAVKMGRYALKCHGLSPRLPPIPIPVDLRVASVSLTSGIITVDRMDKAMVPRLMKSSRLVQDAWDMVAEESHIPPIVLDSAVWLLGGLARRAGCRMSRIRRLAGMEPYLVPREVVEEMFIMMDFYRVFLPIC